jgi:hypothetical protein
MKKLIVLFYLLLPVLMLAKDGPLLCETNSKGTTACFSVSERNDEVIFFDDNLKEIKSLSRSNDTWEREYTMSLPPKTGQ